MILPTFLNGNSFGAMHLVNTEITPCRPVEDSVADTIVLTTRVLLAKS